MVGGNARSTLREGEPDMKKPTAVLTVVLAIFSSRGESSARDLASLIPGLYGGKGIFLAAPPAGSPFPSHASHFSIDSAASINRLNEQITAQIGAFPFSSSVGGFTFAFEPALGTFVRTTETLGPLFAERAPTLGRGKLNLHFSSTFFTYDEFNGKSLDHLRVVARHQPDAIPPNYVRTSLELDTILININLDIHVRLFSLAAIYGVTDRLDVGILDPVASVDMDVKSKAEIITSPENPFPRVHSFVGAPHGP